MSDRYLRAYYHTFSPTGDDKIDAILEAVAYAGKAYHHTEYWDDESGDGNGISFWDAIQKAAEEAASSLAAARARIAALTEVASAAQAYRTAETDGTPRMFRGKALQDLAAALDAKLAALAEPGKPEETRG